MMKNLTYYLWMLILIIYIISPRDIFPGFYDDFIAIGALLYLYLKKAKEKGQKTYSYTGTNSDSSNKSFQENNFNKDLSLGEAYKTLDLPTYASWEEVKKAYKEKIARCHPDKVSHLSKELQEKASELTLKLNNVLEVIKKSRPEKYKSNNSHNVA